jgi:hypothetical protein
MKITLRRFVLPFAVAGIVVSTGSAADPTGLAGYATGAAANLAGTTITYPPGTSMDVINPQKAATERRVRAAEVLDQWIEAQGGVVALKKVRSVIIDGTVEASTNPGVKVRYHSEQTADGCFRHEVYTADGGVLVEAYDGKIGWWQNEKLGFGLIPAAALSDLLCRDDVLAALTVRRNYQYNLAAPDETLEGKLCHVLDLRPTFQTKEPVYWYFDAETALWGGIAIPPVDDRPAISVRFSDYGGIGDLLFPCKVVTTTLGTSVTIVRDRLFLDRPIDRSRFSAPEKLLRDDAEIERILKRHLAVLGGRSAADRIQSRVTRLVVNNLSSGVQSKVVISQKAPNRFLRVEETPGMGRTTTGFDGRIGWANNEIQGYRELKGAELELMALGAHLNLEAYLQTLYPLRRLVDERQVNGHPAKAIILATLTRSAGVHCFDEETGRLVRIESNILAGPTGSLGVTVDFSDFRMLSAVLVPFTTTVTNPALHTVSMIVSVQNNVFLDDAIFKPRKGE